MQETKAFRCEYCNKLFRTNRHRCKLNPTLKNCWACKHLIGWEKGETINHGEGCFEYVPPYPICAKEVETDLDEIKFVNYNMQCESWERKKRNE